MSSSITTYPKEFNGVPSPGWRTGGEATGIGMLVFFGFQVAAFLFGSPLIFRWMFAPRYRPENTLPEFGHLWFWFSVVGAVVAITWAVLDYNLKNAAWESWASIYRAAEERAAEQRRLQQAENERLRLAEEAAEERRRAAAALAQAQAQRLLRLTQLEAFALGIRAQHIASSDFFGGGPMPDSVLSAARADLGRRGIADVGLLRESQNLLVRELVGDGAFLPTAPALAAPVRIFPYRPR